MGLELLIFIVMRDFEILNKSLEEIKGGLTDLYDSSVVEASGDRNCSTICWDTCTSSVGSVTGSTKGVIIEKPIKPVITQL